MNIDSLGLAKRVAEIIHKLKPGRNYVIAGDFKAHHNWWYGDQAVFNEEQIRNDRKYSDTIADWMTHEGMTMVNKAGLDTFFRTSPEGRPSKSIVDLTFHRGICNDLIQCWNIDMEGHRSDHLTTSTTWLIHKPGYFPSRLWTKRDWNGVHQHLQWVQFPPVH